MIANPRGGAYISVSVVTDATTTTRFGHVAVVVVVVIHMFLY